MPEPNDTHSKGNIVMVTDGGSFPDPREWRLINAWSIALVGAVCALFALCLLWPEPYLRILLYLPDGVLITFKITVMSICCAVPLGLLTGLGRISRNRVINLLASTYVEVIRGIPLLVQLFYIYYALSRFFQVSGITSAVIAISVPRYSTRIINAVEFASSQHAKIIAITDSEASPIAPYAGSRLFAKSDMASFGDSLVAPLSIVDALIVAISRRKQRELERVFTRLENIWDEYEVYDKGRI